MQRLRHLLALLLLLAAGLPDRALAADLPLERIQLPPGFSIALWARVDNPREMALGRTGADGGTLFVGSSRAGKVHAVRFDGAFKVKEVKAIASGLRMPDRRRLQGRQSLRLGGQPHPALRRHRAAPRPTARAGAWSPTSFPPRRHHGWKFIAFGPDGKLYVPVGAPCNICEPDPDALRAASRA